MALEGTDHLAQHEHAADCGFCSGTGRHLGLFGHNDPDCAYCEGTGKDGGRRSMRVMGDPGFQQILRRIQDSIPDDIRAKGWKIVLHREEIIDDATVMKWIFTKSPHTLQVAALTDHEALNNVRNQIKLLEDNQRVQS